MHRSRHWEASISTSNASSNQHPGSAIRLVNVTKRYPDAPRPAVADVSLDIEPGEFIVLLGPSGCGKTTLLKMVNRIHEVTSGEIYVDATEIHQLPVEELRRRIGYVIQQAGLFPHMRVKDNVAVVPRLLKWNKARIQTKVNELLDLVGLPAADYANRYPSQLSGGEQQRVGLARAMAAEPGMMLMDEPFGALDAITRSRLQGEIRSIHEQLNQTIIFVTHDIDEALLLADRIVVMRDGQVVQFASPLELVTEPADDFVAELVGSHDTMRRLSLLPVVRALRPLPVDGLNGEAQIDENAVLRDALTHLVETGAPRLLVTDDANKSLGIVTLQSVQEAASRDSRS